MKRPVVRTLTQALTAFGHHHGYNNIQLQGITDPDNDSLNVSVSCIRQDEPLNANGDGNTAIDGLGLGTDTARVRRERQGSGNGRVYHIGFSATDTHGASCWGSVTVGVPKSRSKPAIDNGPLYASTSSETECGPPPQRAPQITSEPSLTVTANLSWSYAVAASDADGDALSYYLLTAPPAMSIDPVSGLVSWSPGLAELGVHPVLLEVSDAGGLTTQQAFEITVAAPPNQPPSGEPQALVVDEDDALPILLLANDPDHDVLPSHDYLLRVH